jgi:hypothetical protein
VTIPAHINARWIATLDDAQLVVAETALHATFRELEISEKSRSGARYLLLQGPAALVSAWHRWLLVNNAVRSRGLATRHA